jgi:hypothetical protein
VFLNGVGRVAQVTGAVESAEVRNKQRRRQLRPFPEVPVHFFHGTYRQPPQLPAPENSPAHHHRLNFHHGPPPLHLRGFPLPRPLRARRGRRTCLPSRFAPASKLQRGRVSVTASRTCPRRLLSLTACSFTPSTLATVPLPVPQPPRRHDARLGDPATEAEDHPRGRHGAYEAVASAFQNLPRCVVVSFFRKVSRFRFLGTRVELKFFRPH